jgi:hypothetical protein
MLGGFAALLCKSPKRPKSPNISALSKNRGKKLLADFDLTPSSLMAEVHFGWVSATHHGNFRMQYPMIPNASADQDF